MGVVQVATHQVIDVVPMGYGLVPAVRTMNMGLVMTRTVMAWRTFVRVGTVHLDAMIVHVIAVRIMQVAIVKIVNVAIVLDSRMATVRAVLVAVSTGMLPVSLRHGCDLFLVRRPPDASTNQPLNGSTRFLRPPKDSSNSALADSISSFICFMFMFFARTAASRRTIAAFK
jgi:hypothetical protein